MPLSYTNRRAKTYYLHIGKTKTGKDKYFCSMKKDGVLLDEVPEGFEIYENPDGLVYLRRKRKTLLTEDELASIGDAMKTMTSLKDYEYKIEHDKDNITVFLLDDDPKSFLEILNPSKARHERYVREFAIRSGTYTAMMRFRLIDTQERLFETERYCFRGSVDDWIRISVAGTLESHAKNFLKHLGKESFYDLIIV